MEQKGHKEGIEKGGMGCGLKKKVGETLQGHFVLCINGLFQDVASPGVTLIG